MADDYPSNKRKFDDQDAAAPQSTRRATGFSAPIVSPTSAASQPQLELAKQKAQEIAARLFNSAEATRVKSENGDNPAYSSEPTLQPTQAQYFFSSSYGSSTSSKKIEIPNGRVGVLIGKGGETIKYLQAQSGAKIQITRDADANPYSQTRDVDITGTSEQVNRAEQLINDVLAEADAGGSGVLAARKVGNTQYGGEQFSMKVPTNKVGLVIGKGGETIKTMQAKSGARIQVIPLHPPPGDTSLERTVQIDGTSEQIEVAKQLVNEVISGENRTRSTGGYTQQSYQAPAQPAAWAPPQQQQQPPQQANYYAQQQYPQYGGYAPYPAQPTNPQAAAQTGYDSSGYGYDYSAYPQQAYGYPPQDGSANTAAAAAAAPGAVPAQQAPQPAQQAPPPGSAAAYGQGGYYGQPGYGYAAPPGQGYGAGPGYATGPGYGAGYGQAPPAGYDAGAAAPASPAGAKSNAAPES